MLLCHRFIHLKNNSSPPNCSLPLISLVLHCFEVLLPSLLYRPLSLQHLLHSGNEQLSIHSCHSACSPRKSPGPLTSAAGTPQSCCVLHVFLLHPRSLSPVTLLPRPEFSRFSQIFLSPPSHSIDNQLQVISVLPCNFSNMSPFRFYFTVRALPFIVISHPGYCVPCFYVAPINPCPSPPQFCPLYSG